MRGAHRHIKRGRTAAGFGLTVAAGCLVTGLLPVWATPPAARHLGIKAHTVSPRYAYAVGGRSLRVQDDCDRHRRVLEVDVQVINHGTRRIDLPVRLRVAWAGPGQVPVTMKVPDIAPGRSAWVHVDLPYANDARALPPATLQLALTAAGQTWNRLRLPAPVASLSCVSPPSAAIAHARENIR